MKLNIDLLTKETMSDMFAVMREHNQMLTEAKEDVKAEPKLNDSVKAEAA